MIEFAGIGIGNLWTVIFAGTVVTVISSALGYVSTFLGVSATAGVASQLAGPIPDDLLYAPAEENADPNIVSSARTLRLY